MTLLEQRYFLRECIICTQSLDSRGFQFGQKKVSIRFDSRYRIDFLFDSSLQSDKFAAGTLIFK